MFGGLGLLLSISFISARVSFSHVFLLYHLLFFELSGSALSVPGRIWLSLRADFGSVTFVMFPYFITWVSPLLPHKHQQSAYGRQGVGVGDPHGISYLN